MRKKRDDVDEIEDGGRAKVVEELVLKAIHSEGERQAKEAGRCSIGGPVRIFPDRSTITFRLLKTLRVYVEGLEVWKNAYSSGLSQISHAPERSRCIWMKWHSN
jgi:hypothetical protein